MGHLKRSGRLFLASLLTLSMLLVAAVSQAESVRNSFRVDGRSYKFIGHYDSRGYPIYQSGHRNYVVTSYNSSDLQTLKPTNMKWRDFYNYYENAETGKTGLYRYYWHRETRDEQGKYSENAAIKRREGRLHFVSSSEVSLPNRHKKASYVGGVDSRVDFEKPASAPLRFQSPQVNEGVPAWKAAGVGQDDANETYASKANETWKNVIDGLEPEERKLAIARIKAIREEIKSQGLDRFSPEAKAMYMSTLSDFSNRAGEFETAQYAESQIPRGQKDQKGYHEFAMEFRKKHAKEDYQLRVRQNEIEKAADERLQALKAKADREGWKPEKRQQVLQSLEKDRSQALRELAEKREFDDDRMASFTGSMDKAIGAEDSEKLITSKMSPGQRVAALDSRLKLLLPKVSRTQESGLENDEKAFLDRKINGYREEIAKLRSKSKLTVEEEQRLSKLEDETKAIEEKVSTAIADAKEGKEKSKHPFAAIKSDRKKCGQFIYGTCSRKAQKLSGSGEKMSLATGVESAMGDRSHGVAILPDVQVKACKKYDAFVGDRVKGVGSTGDVVPDHAKKIIAEEFGDKCELTEKVGSKWYAADGTPSGKEILNFNPAEVSGALAQYKKDHKKYQASSAVRKGSAGPERFAGQIHHASNPEPDAR